MGRIELWTEQTAATSWDFGEPLRLANDTTQTVYCGDATEMSAVADSSVHLIVTSPPYFNAKKYSESPLAGDLGNSVSLADWINGTRRVWEECWRVLQPGRKVFINIMNLPIKTTAGSFRTLNLAGKIIDECEELGFIFKRDIIWHKTNGVRAPFGTYPYPGGILLNNMHEFILEFEKPSSKAEALRKYAHITKEIKDESRLDKEFWLQLKNSDVWTFAPQGGGERRNHPAPFPLELPSRLIRAFTFKGETVLDPFLGSGTTLISAAALGRNGIGYEINPLIARQALNSLEAENARQIDMESITKCNT